MRNFLRWQEQKRLINACESARIKLSMTGVSVSYQNVLNAIKTGAVNCPEGVTHARFAALVCQSNNLDN